MKGKINLKKARKELDKMVEELRTCEPEKAYEVGIAVSSAHYFAYRIGIIDAVELAFKTVEIASIASKQSSESEGKENTNEDLPADPS